MLKYWCSSQKITQHLKQGLQKPHWLTAASQPEDTLKCITSVEPVAATDRSSSVRSGIGRGFGPNISAGLIDTPIGRSGSILADSST
jgi:hypothetical protein